MDPMISELGPFLFRPPRRPNAECDQWRNRSPKNGAELVPNECTTVPVATKPNTWKTEPIRDRIQHQCSFSLNIWVP
jgi:hypothetical protein